MDELLLSDGASICYEHMSNWSLNYADKNVKPGFTSVQYEIEICKNWLHRDITNLTTNLYSKQS